MKRVPQLSEILRPEVAAFNDINAILDYIWKHPPEETVILEHPIFQGIKVPPGKTYRGCILDIVRAVDTGRPVLGDDDYPGLIIDGIECKVYLIPRKNV